MPAVIVNPLGKINIVEDVVATIAGSATVETYGVVGMTARSASDGFWQILGRENIKKGVRTSMHDGAVDIEVFIIVEYGVSIAAVAMSVLEGIHYKVSEMTGLPVNMVHVHVEGIRVDGVYS